MMLLLLLLLPRRQWLGAGVILITSFPLPTFADYFTNPPSFVDSGDGNQIASPDLSMIYIFGKRLQITWFVPSLPNITLSVIHWGDSNDTIITSFLTNKKNRGYYSWTIGSNDGVDLEMISAKPRFGFQLDDPTGKFTSTGNPPGFIKSRLRSRGFIIKPNSETTSGSSTLAITPSTLSPSQQMIVPSPLRTTSSASTTTTKTTTTTTTTTTTASASTTPPLNSNLSRSAVAGLAAGFCVVSILALIAVSLLNFQRRLTKNVQAKNADLVARAEGPAGANSTRPELQASLNVSPTIVELSAFQSFPLEFELGAGRSSRQELSAEKRPT